MDSAKPRLLDEVRQALRRKHSSIRTEEAYIGWIKRFILFHNKRHPTEMGVAEVEAFLTHLAVDGQVAASTQNQALHAVLFLYAEVLRQPLDERIQAARAKRPERLPTVLNRDDVRRLLTELSGIYRLQAQLLYGSGLRLLECLRLRVKDLDFTYHQITIRNGKGQKDRRTMLPNSLVAPLQTHLEQVQAMHQDDLRQGYGTVFLPDALARKFPNAEREWLWQYVFPSQQRSTDPRSGGWAPPPL
jgi:integron integrase